MNVIDAAYAVVHDYPGGSVALAPRMGMSHAILRGKVNANDTGHHLTVAESVRMQHMTGDHRILFAEADELGYMLVHIPSIDADDFAVEALRTVKEFGDFIGKCGDVLADGKVTRNELKQVERELIEAMAHITRLHQLIAAKVGKR